MAYDEELAERVRKSLSGRKGLTERKMFGGIAFMLGGNMCAGVLGSDLIVRVGPEGYEGAMKRPHAKPFGFTGRAMLGMVVVGHEGVRADKDLSGWVGLGAAFAGSLPPKK